MNTTVCCERGADCIIVAKALESAKTMKTVVVGATLIFCPPVIPCSQPHKHRISATKRKGCYENTRELMEYLTRAKIPGKFMSHSPVIRAVTGCDIIFRPYGVGKTSGLKKF